MGCKEKGCIFPVVGERGLCAYHERDLVEAEKFGDSAPVKTVNQIYGMGEKYGDGGQVIVEEKRTKWGRLKERCRGLKNGESFLVTKEDPEIAGRTLAHFANNFRSMLAMGLGKIRFTVRTEGDGLMVTRVADWDLAADLEDPKARGGNFIAEEKKSRIETALKGGASVRETAKEVGVAKNTALRARKKIEEELPEKCGCGRPAGHKGWCAERLAKSPDRQAVVRGLQVKAEDKELYKDLVELLAKLKTDREELDKNIAAVEKVMEMLERRK